MIWRAILILLLFAFFQARPAVSQDYFGIDCPGHWTNAGGGGRCICPDGSDANLIGGQVSCPSQQPQYQPQSQPAPQPVVSCGDWACPLGTTCSQVRPNTCINPGFTECSNGGTCGPGLKCTFDGLHCMPVANSECGNHSCEPGSHCGSRSMCMSDGSNDCGNGSWCSQDRKCSRDGKTCLDKDALDCGRHVCSAGMKCGGGGSCLPIDSADCGNATSCPSDSVCKRGGGCITRAELTQLQADDKAKREAAAAEQKAAEVKRIEDAKEAARLKEEERQRVAAQQKADAEAKKAEQARVKEEARVAALKKIEDDKAAAQAKADEQKRLNEEAQAAARRKLEEERAAALKAAEDRVAEQKRLLDEQREITRLQKEAQQIAAQSKAEEAARARTFPSVPKGSTGSVSSVPVQGPVSTAGEIKVTAGRSQANVAANAPTDSKVTVPSASRQNLIQPGRVSSTEIDMASLKSMANDPRELPVVRQLAASLLISEYGSAATAAKGPTIANQVALQSAPRAVQFSMVT